jgi:hypothetical protein
MQKINFGLDNVGRGLPCPGKLAEKMHRPNQGLKSPSLSVGCHVYGGEITGSTESNACKAVTGKNNKKSLSRVI